MKFETALDHHNCKCHLCVRMLIKEPKATPTYSELMPSTSDGTRDRDYLFIIRRLNSNQRTLRFNIPEIAIFNSSGEIEQVVSQERVGGQYRYKVIKKVPHIQLKRIFQEKRPQNYEQIEYMVRTQHTVSKSDSVVHSRFIQQREKKDSIQKQLDRASVDYAMCRYLDDSIQVLSDADFSSLLKRRRVDPIWQQILYLQNYIKADKYYRINLSVDHNSELYSRAEIEIDIINKDIVVASEQYISQEDEEQFEKQLDGEVLAKYLSYKVIHFIKKQHQITINSGIFEWVCNEQGLYYFVGGQSIRYIMEQQQHCITLTEPTLPTQYHAVTEDDEVVQLYTQIMNNEYIKKKKEVGLDENTFQLRKDNETEQIFNEIHVGSKVAYNDTFKDMTTYLKNETSLLQYVKQSHQQLTKHKSIPKSTNPRSYSLQPMNRTSYYSRPKTSVMPTANRSISRQKDQKHKINTLPYLLFA